MASGHMYTPRTVHGTCNAPAVEIAHVHTVPTCVVTGGERCRRPEKLKPGTPRRLDQIGSVLYSC